MKRFTLILVATTSVVAQAAEHLRAPLALWYAKPATKWSAEALPLGNGRLGCMVFGGVDRERIQFNEDSLWTGDENPSGDYATMGAYQNFGDLFITLDRNHDTNLTSTAVSCPSGHKAYFEHEEVEFSIDRRKDTKWCVEHEKRPVIWQASVTNGAPPVTNYTFTSCADFPERDPKMWRVYGSQDGQQWTTIAMHEQSTPFSKRNETFDFTFKNQIAWRFYRITFLANHGAAHFQIAEINLPGVQREADAPVGYRRELDIEKAISRVEFTRGRVRHVREMFASQPAQAIVLRWTANETGAISGSIELKGAHIETTIANGTSLSFSGSFSNGLRYEAIARVVARGGSVSAEKNHLVLKGCDEATIILAAGTDYVMDAGRKFHGEAPHARLVKAIDSVAAKSFDQLRDEHIKDFRSLIDRCQLSLLTNNSDRESLPTDQRLAAYQKAGGGDPGLEQLLFAYGRYLLISCSRPGALPANLQGLWNDSNNPPWSSDYHVNINVQMNYWPAEPANLAACHLPLLELIRSQLEPWRRATAASREFALPDGRKTRGWAVRTSHNITGGLGWQWDKTANAWYCQHLWWHYEFSANTNYLRDFAYPIIKETCEFWEDHLKALPDGRLVVPNGWSPEHGPHEDGVTYCQEIVWDLFNNYVEAADVLAVDRPYRDKVAAMRDKLVTPKIGSWGQLQEWMTDRDKQKEEHRHTSHLFAVYPGRQISTAKTPDLAQAAAISLAARMETGDSRRSWTWPWRGALWARLDKPEDAHRMVRSLLQYNVLPNLFGNHPPFQMDGNFGITAAMCEMFLQSQAGEIHLLPALPKAWPDGEIKGLRARGGFEVDIAWNQGELTRATVRSTHPRRATIRYATRTTEITVTPGEPKTLTRELK